MYKRLKLSHIFKQKKSLKKDSRSEHVKNLTTADKIFIDGKEYVKVQIRFVDSLDKTGTKVLLCLEEENEALTEKVKELKLENEALKAKVLQIENLNINIFHENKELLGKIEQNKQEILRLKTLEKEYVSKIATAETALRKPKVEELRAEALEEENEALKTKILQIENLNVNIFHENKELLEKIEQDKQEILRLKTFEDEYVSKVATTAETLLQKQKVEELKVETEFAEEPDTENMLTDHQVASYVNVLHKKLSESEHYKNEAWQLKYVKKKVDLLLNKQAVNEKKIKRLNLEFERQRQSRKKIGLENEKLLKEKDRYLFEYNKIKQTLYLKTVELKILTERLDRLEQSKEKDKEL